MIGAKITGKGTAQFKGRQKANEHVKAGEEGIYKVQT